MRQLQKSKTSQQQKDRPLFAKLVASLQTYTRSDTPQELGAGKQYRIPPGPLAQKAMDRLRIEFEVLEQTSSPHVIRVLHTDLGSRLMITEYYPDGTLSEHRARFRGQPLPALQAFKGIVEAVAELHARRVVHRDIKPVNIFVGGDGRLVLGDFGIVFAESGNADRLTDTFERVGARDWMPPWAHTGMRIDDVTPAFDVFSLGKVLWSMLSGREFLPYWYWDRPANDLTQLFPGIAGMPVINERILRSTVVETEGDCLESASELLGRVNEAIDTISGGGQLMGDGTMRCRACGRGIYRPWFQNKYRALLVPSVTDESVRIQASELFRDGQFLTTRVFRCEHCGHIELFHFPDQEPLPAWEGRISAWDRT